MKSYLDLSFKGLWVFFVFCFFVCVCFSHLSSSCLKKERNWWGEDPVPLPRDFELLNLPQTADFN